MKIIVLLVSKPVVSLCNEGPFFTSWDTSQSQVIILVETAGIFAGTLLEDIFETPGNLQDTSQSKELSRLNFQSLHSEKFPTHCLLPIIYSTEKKNVKYSSLRPFS